MANGRVAALDGMRGFAALVVVPYHVLIPLNPSGLKLLRTPFWEIPGADDRWFKLWVSIFNGECAVILFFILSGLVLIGSIERDLATRPMALASASFAVRRVLRIMPTLIACILAMATTMWVLSLVVPGLVAPFASKAVLDNLLLISPSVNGASWTLQVEMMAIPFLIVAGLAARYLGAAGLWGCLVLVFVMTRISWLSDALFPLGGSLLYFMLGCLIPYTANRFRRMVIMPWWMTLLVFLAIRQVLPTTLGFYLQAVFGAFLVAQIYLESPNLLTSPVAQLLGRISYSLYLWNVLFLTAFQAFMPLRPDWMAGHPMLFGLVLSVVIIALTIPVAMWSERFIETPGIRLGRRLTAKVQPAERDRAAK